MKFVLPPIAKPIIIFAGGAAVGSVITYLIVRDKFDKLAEREIAEAREHYTQKIKEVYGAEKKEKKAPELKEENEAVTRERSSIDYSRSIPKEDMVDYTTYYEKKKVVSVASDDPADYEHPLEEDSNYLDGKRDSEIIANAHGIFTISPSEYAIGFPNHEKLTLFYWMADETLSTEEEELIDDPTSVIGNCLETSGMKYSDSDVDIIYVRNLDLGIDYEVQRFPSSYAEQMMY